MKKINISNPCVYALPLNESDFPSDVKFLIDLLILRSAPEGKDSVCILYTQKTEQLCKNIKDQMKTSDSDIEYFYYDFKNTKAETINDFKSKKFILFLLPKNLFSFKSKKTIHELSEKLDQSANLIVLATKTDSFVRSLPHLSSHMTDARFSRFELSPNRF